jgi:hypothetical protein
VFGGMEWGSSGCKSSFFTCLFLHSSLHHLLSGFVRNRERDIGRWKIEIGADE